MSDSAQNRLYLGDNLSIMRQMADRSIDLCYIDPPFNSERNYYRPAAHQSGSPSFSDQWSWDDQAESSLRFFQQSDLPIGKLLDALQPVHGKGGLLVYLVSISLRICEIHRLLKLSGSLYLHCDPTASHYLKMLCDCVFLAGSAKGRFLNEIIWHYRTGGMSKKWFGRKHDVILLYSRNSSGYVFNQGREKSYLSHNYGFSNVKIHQEPPPDGRYYSWVGIRDVWQIEALRGNHPEYCGYPNQKPEALLERIITSSSNHEGVILDAYCGSGTSLVVASRLQRQWIGIDCIRDAIEIAEQRLSKEGIEFEITRAIP